MERAIKLGIYNYANAVSPQLEKPMRVAPSIRQRIVKFSTAVPGLFVGVGVVCFMTGMIAFAAATQSVVTLAFTAGVCTVFAFALPLYFLF
jgi:hypothetical protein